MEETRLSKSVRHSGSTYAVPSIPFAVESWTCASWHCNEVAGSTHFSDTAITRGSSEPRVIAHAPPRIAFWSRCLWDASPWGRNAVELRARNRGGGAHTETSG